ncbi:PhoP family transcriptional regulator [Aerococcus urinaehominis]|uniref:PhoP family transcriptional regulator n=1 Tax=Aerococcus urinaehominis TaxID=128944 RepID=A0A0X8FLD9_9LACT|nr:response regulator transcription factor [Aerococcus urinaehominis]AMB99440.1 PhoP family transcriptional regulator [Aerococcus urinaehominis]SDM28931.1 DNA-binding response regulator, OmpR family, contains REC and winged-helix (wHTH) domain [Aerococcus urinaehominis]
MHLLMIEDSESVQEMMAIFFDQQEGWQVESCYDGESGLAYFEDHQDELDMIILDLNLPKLDGISVCQAIRQQNKLIPIIMLTARDSESDQVLGFNVGADDYVTKPFSPVTLLARIQALYRRYRSQMNDDGQANNQGEVPGMVKTGQLTINPATREVIYMGQEIANLTPKEFEILNLLASHPKQVFTRDHLLNSLWESPFYGDERTVDAHIKKLRQKIEKIGPSLIQTVWGVGYKYEEVEVD